MNNTEKMIHLKKKLLQTMNETEHIKKEMTEVRSNLKLVGGAKIVELELFKLLEWEVDYRFSHMRESLLKFVCSNPTYTFNREVKDITVGMNTVWEPIQIGSFSVFFSDDFVTVSVRIKKWSELILYLSEAKEYGIEKVSLSDLKRSFLNNQARVLQQRTLIDGCAEVFTIKPKSKSDDNKNGVD